jgi:hypothetical protein
MVEKFGNKKYCDIFAALNTFFEYNFADNYPNSINLTNLYVSTDDKGLREKRELLFILTQVC